MSEPVGNSPRGDFPGNSHRQRDAVAPSVTPEAPEPAEKIVTGKVSIKKAPWWRRLGRSMVAEDINDVGEFVVTDVLAPALRNLVYEIIVQGSGRGIYGGKQPRPIIGGSGVSAIKSNTSYNRISQAPQGQSRELSQSSRARHDFDPISLDTRTEAVEVIEELNARVLRYGQASVADLYNMLGTTSAFTDRNWGWRDLSGSDVRQVRGGWLLVLPRPELLS